MQKIKNIIFDLGNVLLDVDFNKTNEAFEALGIKSFQSMFNQFYSNPLFEFLETGKIDPITFFNEVRKITSLPISNIEILNAWNAMLVSFRKNSILLLPTLKKNYNIFLLSNTNQLHYDAFQKIYYNQFGNNNFESLFHKAYYSHELKLRKPDAAIFEKVMEENNMDASETLFIDDTINHINTARQLGLQTIHLKADERVENIDWGI